MPVCEEEKSVEWGNSREIIESNIIQYLIGCEHY